MHMSLCTAVMQDADADNGAKQKVWLFLPSRLLQKSFLCSQLRNPRCWKCRKRKLETFKAEHGSGAAIKPAAAVQAPPQPSAAAPEATSAEKIWRLSGAPPPGTTPEPVSVSRVTSLRVFVQDNAVQGLSEAHCHSCGLHLRSWSVCSATLQHIGAGRAYC